MTICAKHHREIVLNGEGEPFCPDCWWEAEPQEVRDRTLATMRAIDQVAAEMIAKGQIVVGATPTGGTE